MSEPTGLEIAVVGMSGRFPGAPDLAAYWRNLVDGVESVRRFSREELLARGVAPEMIAHPDYVPASPVLDGVESFDADFFGFNPREAEIIDPQQRLFLECAWETLEDAGYDPGIFDGAIGVYAGSGMNSYLLRHILENPGYVDSVGRMQALIGNEKDYLATRTAFKLDLRGPSVTVQTACSTSLVAVHLACQGLLSGDCDMALAGGVSIALPQAGYLYQKGGIDSPDGRCRPFDADGEGTLFGSGVGIVALRRLADAVDDGDGVRAVIRGTAINNDGAAKIGFTAPGVDGQTRVIRDAQRMAEVDPDSISYIEAHGTATALGDPIEIEALNRVFRERTSRRGFCALGSVKSNVGHLDTAAGMAGLLKTVLALEHGVIPPSLHFEKPNPQIDFAASPFFVNVSSREWAHDGGARRAGVSSFGIGGANAHVVLEEAPPARPGSAGRERQLLLLSARTAAALGQVTGRLADHLEAHPEVGLADVAYTLHAGRRAGDHRAVLVARGRDDALAALTAGGERLATHHQEPARRPLAFLFPGQGAQVPGMAAALYRGEPTFRERVDACAEILADDLELDLRRLLWPEAGGGEEAARQLRHTAVAQPALFVIEYALAELLGEWGLRPQAMIGHSIGEYVAACLAGVIGLEDALRLVAARGRLMGSLPGGAMLAVHLPEDEARGLLGRQLSLAAVNSAALSVVSGAFEAVDELAGRLADRGVDHRRLHTSHAFHSAAMEPILGPFAEVLAKVSFHPPRTPYLSNLTGTWVRGDEVTRASYWLRHLRETVRFSRGLGELLTERHRVLLEVGPGHTLGALARRHPDHDARHQAVLACLPGPTTGTDALETLLGTAGRLWMIGVDLDPAGFYRHQERRRIPLPTYPFERRRYWIERHGPIAAPRAARPEEDTEPSAGGLSEHGLSEHGLSEHDRPLLSVAWVAPGNATETALAAIWSESLGVGRIGVHDDFLELGGHSLLATRITERLRRELGVDLSVRQLFEHPTVAGLAALVESSAGSAGDAGEHFELPPLLADPERRPEPFPLTEVQEAYWIGRQDVFELGNVGTHSYVELEGDNLDLPRFEAALGRVIERHEMLRAVFTDDGRQRILAEVPPYEIRVLDLSELDAAAAEREVLAVREAMSHQVLPADRWPLFEVRATRLPGDRGTAGTTRLHVSFDFLIGDAWSLRILAHDVLHAYGGGVPLPEVGLSFRDYVLAERALAGTEPWQRSLDYWLELLPELPPAPELPLAVEPSALDQPRFTRHAARLGRELWESLRNRAREQGLTPSGVLLAAFAEILGMWSRNPRMTLNLTLFNRLPFDERIGDVVGDFTSLTLVPVDAGERRPFRERAGRVQRQLWENLDHRLTSGVRVQRELARVRGAAGARMPVVFTSTLALGDAAAAPAGAAAELTDWELVYSVSQTPQVWIDHQVDEVGGELSLSWDVVEELFPAGVPGEMFAAYRELLRCLAEDGGAWEQVAPRAAPEAHLVARAAVNATSAPRPDARLEALFVEQARRRPSHPAVVAAGRRLSYGELLHAAGAVAERLRERGARPGALVAVVTEKGWEQVVAVLAVLTAGAAYLPIDPALPTRRRHDLLADGEAEVALTQPWLAERLEWPAGIEVLSVDAAAGDRGATPSGADDPRAAEDLAYVIFTSGSTGRPKGVMIDHRGAVNTIADVNRRFEVGPGDRVLALSSLGFDLSVYDLFGLLAAGGTVVMPEASAVREPRRWLELLEAEEVTVWNTVPALAELLVEEAAGLGVALPASLRLVLLSGDWIPLGLPERIRALHPRPEALELISLGGATEASVWSILFPVGDVDPSWRSVPYGKPMANQSFQVLSSALEPRPVWVPGELYIGGVGLALGYWRDAATTDERFITWPATGERLYRTGDLGRYLDDGNIEFLGRVDFQVKLRGHRIELGEIETVLAEHPGVRQAVALLRRDGESDPRIVAYCLGEPDFARDLAAAARPAPFAEPGAWDAIVRVGREQAASHAPPPSGPEAEATRRELERLVEGYMARALRELGLFRQAGEAHRIEELAEAVRIEDRYHRLIHLWLETLAEAGLLEEPEEGLFRNPAALPEEPLEELWDALRAKGLLGGGVGQILHTSGENLTALLRGELSALQVFFPEGSWDRAEEFYETAHGIHDVSAAILAAAGERFDRERPLRVLEVGAGTGGTSTFLFPVLPAESTEYVFTDISLFFTQQAAEKYREVPWVRYGVLDIEHRPVDQGFEPHAWDVVVAGNVLHGVENLDTALLHARSLLAPGGLLLLEEATRWEKTDSISIGLIEGLTRFGDTWRDKVPFISARRWEEALAAAGFEGFAAFPDTDDAASQVLVARAPTAPVRPDALLGSAALRSFLEERLPRVMVPAAVMVLEALPLTANGKIDRAALPSPEWTGSEEKACFVAPRDEREETLAEIWREVLGTSEIGIHDNFFDLGGDSIIAIRLSSLAHRRGLGLSARQALEHLTVAEQAAVAETLRPTLEEAPAETATEAAGPDLELAGLSSDELAGALAQVRFEGDDG